MLAELISVFTASPSTFGSFCISISISICLNLNHLTALINAVSYPPDIQTGSPLCDRATGTLLLKGEYLAVINIIDAFTSVVGVGLMIPSLLPEKDDIKTVVRVAAGLSINEKKNTAGNQPGISLYDIMGRRIGWTAGHSTKIKDGVFIDIKVPV